MQFVEYSILEMFQGIDKCVADTRCCDQQRPIKTEFNKLGVVHCVG